MSPSPRISRPGPALAVAATAAVLAGCGSPDGNTVTLPEREAARRGDDPPVMTSPAARVGYPMALFLRGIEGKVVLRLYVDETGRMVPESIKVAESSGYPAFDSAALAAAPGFRFAPALHNGSPVAAVFLQPVHFRHPQAGGTTP